MAAHRYADSTGETSGERRSTGHVSEVLARMEHPAPPETGRLVGRRRGAVA